MTITYTVVSHGNQSFLVEQKYMTAFKPVTPFVRHVPGPVLKTRNLLQVIVSRGAGQGVLSSVADLNGMTVDGPAEDSMGKAKEQ